MVAAGGENRYKADASATGARAAWADGQNNKNTKPRKK
jgi:hypothetical protein